MFRVVTETFAVSPQIFPSDLEAAKTLGFTLVINNRPDGEASDQPSSMEMAAAAKEQGLDYAHIPVVGRPTTEQIAAVAALASRGKTLAYCRSGARSIMTWAMGELAAGHLNRRELLRLAETAGYDLEGVLPA